MISMCGLRSWGGSLMSPERGWWLGVEVGAGRGRGGYHLRLPSACLPAQHAGPKLKVLLAAEQREAWMFLIITQSPVYTWGLLPGRWPHSTSCHYNSRLHLCWPTSQINPCQVNYLLHSCRVELPDLTCWAHWHLKDKHNHLGTQTRSLPPPNWVIGLISCINTSHIIFMVITVSVYNRMEPEEANETGRQRNLRTVCILNRARHDET